MFCRVKSMALYTLRFPRLLLQISKILPTWIRQAYTPIPTSGQQESGNPSLGYSLPAAEWLPLFGTRANQKLAHSLLFKCACIALTDFSLHLYRSLLYTNMKGYTLFERKGEGQQYS